MLQGHGAVDDELQAKKHQAEPQDGLAEILHDAAAPEIADGEPKTDQQGRVGDDVEGDELHGEGGADIGAQDEAQGLAKRHEAG